MDTGQFERMYTGLEARMCAGKWQATPNCQMDFIRDSMNMKELCYSDFQGYTGQLVTSQRCVWHIRARCVSIGESSPMQTCSHEEADTIIVVHLLHSLKQGEHTIYVRIVDPDVVVILAGTFHDLVATQPLGDI